MGDHGFVSTKQKPAAAGRTWRLLALRRYRRKEFRHSPRLGGTVAQKSRQALLQRVILLFLQARHDSHTATAAQIPLCNDRGCKAVFEQAAVSDPQPAKVATTTAAPASDPIAA
jgi:hypothetical protein